MTDAKTQKWMERCIQSFVSQLNSGSAITGSAILTDASQPSWIAWLRQLRGLDDSRQWIPEIHIYSVDVEKGSEGAVIEIQPL